MKAPAAKTTGRRAMRLRLRSATRATLLHASEQIFAEKGLDRARMEDIAARAGVAVGTLYNYFADSAALVDDLVLERRREMLAHLDEALADARARRVPWPGQVEAFIRATLDCTRDHLPFHAVLMQCENRKTPASMGGVSAELYRRADTLVRNGVSLGRVGGSDAALLPAVLVMLCRAPLLRLRHAGPDAGWSDELTGQITRFFCAAAVSGAAPFPGGDPGRGVAAAEGAH